MKPKFLIALAALVSTLCPAETWTNKEGKPLTADFVSVEMDGETPKALRVRKPGQKAIPIRWDMLSKKSQELALSLQEKSSSPSEETGELPTLEPIFLKPGRILVEHDFEKTNPLIGDIATEFSIVDGKAVGKLASEEKISAYVGKKDPEELAGHMDIDRKMAEEMKEGYILSGEIMFKLSDESPDYYKKRRPLGRVGLGHHTNEINFHLNNTVAVVGAFTEGRVEGKFPKPDDKYGVQSGQWYRFVMEGKEYEFVMSISGIPSVYIKSEKGFPGEKLFPLRLAGPVRGEIHLDNLVIREAKQVQENWEETKTSVLKNLN